MSDKFSDKILAEAQRLEQALKKPEPEPIQYEKQKELRDQSDHFRTWYRLIFIGNEWALGSVFTFYVGLITVYCILGIEDDLITKYIIYAAIIGIVFIILFSFIHFIYYRNWRNRLPFKLIGWAELVSIRRFNKSVWRNATIKIQLNETANDEQRKVYIAALTLFCHRANKKYYSTDFSDARNTWKVKGLQASGSINNIIAFRLYSFCKNTLTKLQLERAALNFMIIEVDKRSFSVSIPSSD
jgi:hypothetical protein